MKRFFLALIITFTGLLANAQKDYWQQEVNYNIDISLNDRNHTLRGMLNLEYINHSPDKLEFIWFHLWPNAYRNETTAYAKQIMRDKDGKKRWKDMKDKGSIDSLNFTIDGQSAKTEPDPENIDIIKVILPKALQPGEKLNISTPFVVKIPSYSSRSGHLGDSYMICQWYPKPAVYDSKGWHQFPYLDQGEFYSEFGNFAVSITLPSAYVVGATGLLQDADELNKYKEIGKINYADTKKDLKYTASSSGMKALHYTASNVHDFAWFADKDFIIRYDTAALASGKVIDVFTYGHENGNSSWRKSVSFVEDAIRHYSRWIGEYPYPIAQAVEGPKNVMSGGMEYPTITLITSPNANEEEMDGVIAHEVGHNWFYGILGSNERDHAWMDEGMNTYFQFRYEAEKYRANSVFGNALPAELKQKPMNEFQSAVYNAISQIPTSEAIETTSSAFPNKDDYATVIYLKTAVWMYLVELALGSEKMDNVIKAYFNDWKFKHPYPDDLKAEFEKQAGSGVDDIFKLLYQKGNF